MQKKNVIIILLTAVLFISAVVLGFTSVYRVTEVTVTSSVVSEAAKSEADTLQKQLQAAYDKQNIFSADDLSAREIVAQYPYFRMISFEKSYPNRLVVSITEDAEVYTVAKQDDSNMHYILNVEGFVLGIREDTANRSDGADNLPIYGLTASGSVGAMLSGDACLQTLLTFLNQVSTQLNGIRRNVCAVEVIRRTAIVEETVFKLAMREGVDVYVRNPFAFTAEKVETAINAYMGLRSEQKLTGMIMVSDVNEEIIVNYSSMDVFD